MATFDDLPPLARAEAELDALPKDEDHPLFDVSIVDRRSRGDALAVAQRWIDKRAKRYPEPKREVDPDSAEFKELTRAWRADVAAKAAKGSRDRSEFAGQAADHLSRADKARA